MHFRQPTPKKERVDMDMVRNVMELRSKRMSFRAIARALDKDVRQIYRWYEKIPRLIQESYPQEN